MKKIALPCWQDRVSPVFDVAARVVLYEVGEGAAAGRRELVFATDGAAGRVASLTAAGIDVLICGAISWPLELAVTAAGIEVIAQICGDIEQVMLAFAEGHLKKQEDFLMPGCCRRGRRRRAGHGRQQGR